MSVSDSSRRFSPSAFAVSSSATRSVSDSPTSSSVFGWSLCPYVGSTGTTISGTGSTPKVGSPRIPSSQERTVRPVHGLEETRNAHCVPVYRSSQFTPRRSRPPSLGCFRIR